MDEFIYSGTAIRIMHLDVSLDCPPLAASPGELPYQLKGP